jgi:hypothetical protein
MQNEAGEVSYKVLFANGDIQTKTQSKRVYYYEGSILPIEWTDQHGCGSNSKVSCEIVIQYACEDTLDPKVDNFWPWTAEKAGTGSTYFGQQSFRPSGNDVAAPRDGIPVNANDAATDTIPDTFNAAQCDTRNERRYGMHENYHYYQLCQRTERNKGLYTADQNLRRRDQRATRQNPNGNRNGLECPEERDHYPWWHPSPWIDVAVLSDSAGTEPCMSADQIGCTQRCQYYLNETMNSHHKGYCDVNHESQTVSAKTGSTAWNQRRWHNHRESCESAGFTWYEVSHADNLHWGDGSKNNGFVCAHTQFARVNQLGNAMADTVLSQNDMDKNIDKEAPHGINANRFLWTVPTIPTAKAGTAYFTDMEAAYKSCTMRLRYNISSSDFPAWPREATGAGVEEMVDWGNNTLRTGPTADRAKNTPLTQDPYVYIGPGATAGSTQHDERFLSLAVNTNQYSRTFQDRTFSFEIRKRPTASSAYDSHTDAPAYNAADVNARLEAGGRIFNVNVRGKRGNIVQTYPSVEYDFVPNALALEQNDMVHFQWTGSDYNPRRGCNNGEGGPPDPNTFSTSAGANKASRADRSNVVLTDYMADNVPKDYITYAARTSTWDTTSKVDNNKASVTSHAPCYDPQDTSGDANRRQTECYDTMMRLAYLAQQTDLYSLTKRGAADCLDQAQLDAIGNSAIRENHPLNCAKLNAKPHPYFDGGIIFMRRGGKFPYFSSRNNNFSNRQQIGLICVSSADFNCTADPLTGVIQDSNPLKTGLKTKMEANLAISPCDDDTGGANQFGAPVSCVPEQNEILEAETTVRQEGDNDSLGDGNEQDCPVLSYSTTTSLLGQSASDSKAAGEVGLGIGLGIMFAVLIWASYYLYNTWQRKYGSDKDTGPAYADSKSWQRKNGRDLVAAKRGPAAFKSMPLGTTGRSGAGHRAKADASGFFDSPAPNEYDADQMAMSSQSKSRSPSARVAMHENPLSRSRSPSERQQTHVPSPRAQNFSGYRPEMGPMRKSPNYVKRPPPPPLQSSSSHRAQSPSASRARSPNRSGTANFDYNESQPPRRTRSNKSRPVPGLSDMI